MSSVSAHVPCFVTFSPLAVRWKENGIGPSEPFYINHEHNHCQREVGIEQTHQRNQRNAVSLVDLFDPCC